LVFIKELGMELKNKEYEFLIENLVDFTDKLGKI